MPRVAKPDQTDFAKKKGFYETLFISENIEAIFDKKKSAGPKGGTGMSTKTNKKGVSSLSNKRLQLSAMKVAFEPMGQHELRDKTDPSKEATAAKLKALKKKPANWPRKVLSFELWAEATSYDPTAKDGGVQFQRMLQFLLVNGPLASAKGVELNDDKYYSVEDKKHRGPGWYEPKASATFKGTPHTLLLSKDSYKDRSWHTPQTQGALNNSKHLEGAGATGGRQGSRSNTDDSYFKEL